MWEKVEEAGRDAGEAKRDGTGRTETWLMSPYEVMLNLRACMRVSVDHYQSRREEGRVRTFRPRSLHGESEVRQNSV